MNVVMMSTSLLFHTEEIQSDPEVRLEINSLARRWQLFSMERTYKETDPQRIAVYHCARKVNKIVSQRTLKKNFSMNFSVIVTYGLSLEIRSYALIKTKEIEQKSYIHLCFLSSDPSNLFGENRIKGLGERVILFLFQKCRDEGLSGIFVEPLEGAREFCKKQGFKPIEDRQPFAMIWQP